MAKTVISGTDPFCSPQQFINRHDWRTVARLLTDSDTGPALDQAGVLASTVLLSFLKAASGEVEAATFNGNRYALADLYALDGTNAGERLADLVADLTMWRVWRRRPRKEETAPVDVDACERFLDRLASGESILGFQETANASHMEHRLRSPGQVTRNNGVEVQAVRYFGRRSDRHPCDPSP